MRKFLSGVFVVVLLLVGLSFSYSDNANAAPKKEVLLL